MNVADTGLFAASFGGMTALGGVVGFAAKKVAKLVAVLVGLELALFAVLERQGILTVNWDQLAAWSSPEVALDPSLLDVLLSTGLLGGGFGAGFAYGFHKG